MHHSSYLFPLIVLQFRKPIDLLLDTGIQLTKLIDSQMEGIDNDLNVNTVIDTGSHEAIDAHADRASTVELTVDGTSREIDLIV